MFFLWCIPWFKPIVQTLWSNTNEGKGKGIGEGKNYIIDTQSKLNCFEEHEKG